MDYEELPEEASTLHHMLAGSCAGVMEHCVVYPVDSVKTRLQCLRQTGVSHCETLSGGLKQLLFKEGIVRSFRGSGAVMFGAAPAHAIYFSIYEHMKKTLISRTSLESGSNHLAHAVSGFCATLAHDAVMTPADAVKQRLQMSCIRCKNSLHCLVDVCRSEGVGALYRAYTTQLMLNGPFQVVHFTTYEALQHRLNPRREYRPWTHIVAGGVAGSLAALVTTPLDVCKTVLNTQTLMNLPVNAAPVAAAASPPSTVVASPPPPTPSPPSSLNATAAAAMPPLLNEPVSSASLPNSAKPVPCPSAATCPNVAAVNTAPRPPVVRGFYGALQTILAAEGPRGLAKGMSARVLTTLPGTAVSWSVYEYFKWRLSDNSQLIQVAKDYVPPTTVVARVEGREGDE